MANSRLECYRNPGPDPQQATFFQRTDGQTDTHIFTYIKHFDWRQ